MNTTKSIQHLVKAEFQVEVVIQRKGLNKGVFRLTTALKTLSTQMLYSNWILGLNITAKQRV